MPHPKVNVNLGSALRPSFHCLSALVKLLNFSEQVSSPGIGDENNYGISCKVPIKAEGSNLSTHNILATVRCHHHQLHPSFTFSHSLYFTHVLRYGICR